MTMGNQPSQQLLLFAQSVLLGLSAGVLYDLLRPFRRKRPGIVHLLDGGYCLVVGAALFRLILQRGDGELRGFMILGAAGGLILFFCAFSRFLQPVWDFWADTLAVLASLVSIPVRFTRKFCKKMVRRGKNLFYFARKCYTMNHTGETRQFTKEAADMRAKKNVDRPRASILIKVVVVVLLVALGWKVYDLQGQITAAEEEKARYAEQVAQMEQENAALEADIAEGPTDEKLQDIARDELGFVKPGEYVFDPTN